jgi:hypothetical protein
MRCWRPQIRMPDYAAQLWDRAEECRALGTSATDVNLKALYKKLANAYLKLAAEEERLRTHELTTALTALPKL